MTPISTFTPPPFSVNDTVFRIPELLQNILRFLPFHDAEAMCCVSKRLEEKVHSLVIYDRSKEVNAFIARVFNRFTSLLIHKTPFRQIRNGFKTIEVPSYMDPFEESADVSIYRNNPKHQFFTTPAFFQNFRLHSRLAPGLWRLTPDKNFEGSLCQISDSSSSFDTSTELRVTDLEEQGLRDMQEALIAGDFDSLINFRQAILRARNKMIHFSDSQKDGSLAPVVKDRVPEFFELTQSLLSECRLTRARVKFGPNGIKEEKEQELGIREFSLSILREALDGQWLSAMDRLDSLVEYLKKNMDERRAREQLDNFISEISWAVIHAGGCDKIIQIASFIEKDSIKNKFLSAVARQLKRSNLQNAEDLVNEIQFHDSYSSEDREFLDQIDTLLKEQKFDEALALTGPFEWKAIPLQDDERRPKEIDAFCRIALALAEDRGLEIALNKLKHSSTPYLRSECSRSWIREGAFDKVLELARQMPHVPGTGHICMKAIIAGQDELVWEFIQEQDFAELFPFYVLGLAKAKKFEKALELVAAYRLIEEMNKRLAEQTQRSSAVFFLENFVCELVEAGKTGEEFDPMDELLSRLPQSEKVVSAFVRAKKFDEALARIDKLAYQQKASALQQIAIGYAEEGLLDKAVELLETAFQMAVDVQGNRDSIERQLEAYRYALAKDQSQNEHL